MFAGCHTTTVVHDHEKQRVAVYIFKEKEQSFTPLYIHNDDIDDIDDDDDD